MEQKQLLCTIHTVQIVMECMEMKFFRPAVQGNYLKIKTISSYLGTPKGSFQKVEPNGDQPMNKSGLPSQCRVHANGEIY